MPNNVTIDAVDRVVSILTSELAGSQVAVGNSSVVPLPADGFIVVSEETGCGWRATDWHPVFANHGEVLGAEGGNAGRGFAGAARMRRAVGPPNQFAHAHPRGEGTRD